MPNIGRNDPCHCGSGKKYKQCHLRIDEQAPAPVESPGAILHNRDEEVAVRLFRYARDRFGERWVADATKAYSGGTAKLADPESQIFVPWSLYIYETRGRTAAALYLDERGGKLSDDERELIAAQQAAHLSIWEIEGVDPGRGLSIRDLLTGDSRFVEEETGSHELGKGDALLARVVDAGGISIFSGLHPHKLAPEPTTEVIERIRARYGFTPGAVDPERLADRRTAAIFLEEWRAAVA